MNRLVSVFICFAVFVGLYGCTGNGSESSTTVPDRPSADPLNDSDFDLLSQFPVKDYRKGGAILNIQTEPQPGTLLTMTGSLNWVDTAADLKGTITVNGIVQSKFDMLLKDQKIYIRERGPKVSSAAPTSTTSESTQKASDKWFRYEAKEVRDQPQVKLLEQVFVMGTPQPTNRAELKSNNFMFDHYEKIAGDSYTVYKSDLGYFTLSEATGLLRRFKSQIIGIEGDSFYEFTKFGRKTITAPARADYTDMKPQTTTPAK